MPANPPTTQPMLAPHSGRAVLLTGVHVSFEKKQVTVVLDTAKTTAAALTRAMADAGYSSTPHSGSTSDKGRSK